MRFLFPLKKTFQSELLKSIIVVNTVMISCCYLNKVVAADIIIPEAVKNDWIQLKSDELLQGSIRSLYDNKLEFKSDKLGILEINWNDIKSLHSTTDMSVGFTDFKTKSGTLKVVDGKSYIDDVEFNTDDIMTIIPDGDHKESIWINKIALGTNIHAGNSEQLNYTGFVNIKRRTTKTRFNFHYIGNYSRTDSKSTVNNHRINSNIDWFLSKRFFIRPIFIEVYKDPFLNIDYKFTASAGIGYTFIDTDKTKLSFNLGPGFTQTHYKYDDSSNTENSASAVISSNYKTELTDNIDFKSRYRMQYSDESTGGYTHHALAGINVELTDIIDLNIAILWDHVSNPTIGSNDVRPKKNDYQFIVGFEIEI